MILILVFATVSGFAQTEEFITPETLEMDFVEEMHPIDIEVNKLMEADESTNGQIQALAKGYDLWDAELNAAYKELMQAYGTSEKLKSTLKEAQLAWIKYRDASFKHFEAVCESREGSMYRVFLANDRMDFIKTRALELRSMHSSYTETN